ncbi:hypothetical protein NQ318_013204 [Aromia moschata]|uniref:PiggyBac transposable element-derived protein domain-containing protein n=1 Tax=Aromia moschata TaxID=1265417 RepID=A0AAV8XHM4_9CUCU|nr:hypothetical protein NQ318_013204 [Aromia moschata]
MSSRGKRILQLALTQQYDDSDDDQDVEDPFATDSDDDPVYIPKSSSDEFSSDSTDSDPDNIPQAGVEGTYIQLVESESNENEIVREIIPVEHEFSENQDVHSSGEPQLDQRQPKLYDISSSIWGPPQGQHLAFDETFVGGITPEWSGALKGEKPIQYFLAFVDFDIIDMIVNQTNHYATQILIETKNISNKARVQTGEPTDRKEIMHFIGLLGYMGIVRMSSLRDYWSTKWIFSNKVAKNIMSRNRFEILLKMFHFSDNSLCPKGDRIYKVQPLLDRLIQNYKKIYTPRKMFCIDESVIPFQGRLVFKQYNPQKTHKYGIKIFKLCCENGYTWNMSIYSGKEKEQIAITPNTESILVATKVVLNLSEELLGSGRICVIDNWYTSLQLAHILLDKHTHCLGTLRSNRKGNPNEVIKKKLKKDEVVAQENERGICVLKWRDKRDVLVLSTCHSNETVQVQRRGKKINKPQAIIDYNKGKSSIDISDQMSSYSTALRRSIRWYKKVAIEILLGTSMVNAHFIFRELEDSDLSISDFRISVIEDLLMFESEKVKDDPKISQSLRSHVFIKLDCRARENRKYCRGCYKKKQEGLLEKSKNKFY